MILWFERYFGIFQMQLVIAGIFYDSMIHFQAMALKKMM